MTFLEYGNALYHRVSCIVLIFNFFIWNEILAKFKN